MKRIDILTLHVQPQLEPIVWGQAAGQAAAIAAQLVYPDIDLIKVETNKDDSITWYIEVPE